MIIGLPKWLEDIRTAEVVRRVRDDPRSVGGSLLGVSFDVARIEVAGGGQANFDEPWGDLSPDDRVLLYAYCIQKGHLEELTAAFRMLFANNPVNKPIVLDLGCGPCTGGLAIASELGDQPRFDYIGVDKSNAMRRLGERLAVAPTQMSEVRRQWARDISSVSWQQAPGWRPVIVIVSYLLASPTLDATELIGQLDCLLAKFGRGPVTVLFTNSPQAHSNRSFPEFSGALLDAGFRLCADDTGRIGIGRMSGVRRRPLRYALFHRPLRHTLALGD